MNLKELPTKTKIIIVASIVVVVAFVFMIITGDKENKKQAEKRVDSVFATRTTDPTSKRTFKTTTSTLPEPTTPFNSSTKAKLRELPATGRIDPNYPQNYLSPRWEAIVYGELYHGDHLDSHDARGTVPITELNDSANSDLDSEQFKALRDIAIDVARSEATGIGTSAHPKYFTERVYIDSCKDFKVDAAGAISMPFVNDNSWAMAIVYWNARCFPYGENKASKLTKTNQTIFLHFQNGKWFAVQQSSLPGIRQF